MLWRNRYSVCRPGRHCRAKITSFYWSNSMVCFDVANGYSYPFLSFSNLSFCFRFLKFYVESRKKKKKRGSSATYLTQTVRWGAGGQTKSLNRIISKFQRDFSGSRTFCYPTLSIYYVLSQFKVQDSQCR